MKVQGPISPKLSLNGWYFGGDEYSDLGAIIEKLAKDCAAETIQNVFSQMPSWNPVIINDHEDGPTLVLEWIFDDARDRAKVHLQFSELARYLDHKDRPTLSAALRDMADHIDGMSEDE